MTKKTNAEHQRAWRRRQRELIEDMQATIRLQHAKIAQLKRKVAKLTKRSKRYG